MYQVETLAPEEKIFEPLDYDALDYLKESIPVIIKNTEKKGISIIYEFKPLIEDDQNVQEQNENGEISGCKASNECIVNPDTIYRLKRAAGSMPEVKETAILWD